MANEFDVVIIGGGAAGENVVGRTAPAGLKTAIVESELVGGECSYWACMPSKALLRPFEALNAARRVPGARDAVTGDVDVEKTLRSRDAFSSNWDDSGQAQWVESAGGTLYRGYARLAGPKQVQVIGHDGSEQTLTARRAVVVATGTVPALPPIEGLAEVKPWTSREITTAKSVPERLVVLGGGVVGAEMAQAWRSLGAKEVTIIEMRSRLLPFQEPFAGELVEQAFRSMGIDVKTGAAATSAMRTNGVVTVELDDGSRVQGDELLVATGRKPATMDIGLESLGLEPGKFIKVNDQLQAADVDGGWLYAVGDVNGRALFTHQGKYQARIAGDHIVGKDVAAWADNVAVPRVIFTEPQVAAVGPTEEQARERGIHFQVIEVPFGSTAAAALMGQGVEGRAKLLIDAQRRTIVGATFAGPNAGELVHAATIAIVGKVTLDDLWHAVPAFPTLSELWLRLLESYGL